MDLRVRVIFQGRLNQNAGLQCPAEAISDLCQETKLALAQLDLIALGTCFDTLRVNFQESFNTKLAQKNPSGQNFFFDWVTSRRTPWNLGR